MTKEPYSGLQLYEHISQLCAMHGITMAGLAQGCGISKGNLSDLKANRKKHLSCKTILAIADYFSLSMEQILGIVPILQDHGDSSVPQRAFYLSQDECDLLRTVLTIGIYGNDPCPPSLQGNKNAAWKSFYQMCKQTNEANLREKLRYPCDAK